MTPSPIEPRLVCSLFPWHTRLNYRYSGLAGMFLLFAVWFGYDGKVAWPAQNLQAEQMESYKETITEGFKKAQAAGESATWTTAAKAKGVEFNAQGEPLSWAAFAARKGWPDKPKKRKPAEIEQQMYWSAAMGLLFLLVLGRVYAVRHQQLIAEADAFITPDGKRIAFADAFKIDKRPWDTKGYATVHYRVDGTGPERKATIDDLKFDGASLVLARLEENFHGDILITETDDADANEEPVKEEA
jgi:hypothetical protein